MWMFSFILSRFYPICTYRASYNGFGFRWREKGGVIFQGQLDLKSKAEVAFWCFETLVQLT